MTHGQRTPSPLTAGAAPSLGGRWGRIAATALAATALAALWLAAAAEAAAPRRELPKLSAKQLSQRDEVPLSSDWLYHPGDDPSFAFHDLDDSGWDEVDASFGAGETPNDWGGTGWFRLRFLVDPALEGKALALRLRQFGAAEVYLDGEELCRFGTVAPRAEDTVPRLQRQPHLFAFDRRGEHVLAVRFANHDAAAFAALGRVGGFKVWIGEPNQRLAVFGDNLRNHSLAKAFFTGVFASFALLHFLLFAFYPKISENLYFALLTGSGAVVVFLFLDSYATTDPRFFLRYDSAMNVGWLAVSLFALRFVYSVFYERLRRSFHVAVAAAAVLAVPGWLWPRATTKWIWLLVLATSVEMCRAVAMALYRRKPGARIVGFGVLVLAGGIAIQLLAGFDVLAANVATLFTIPFGSMLLLLLSMSIHLSWRYADTQRELLAQLRAVRTLSEQSLQQERHAREEEVGRARLEAAYAGKVEELEEARQLQLSMLPANLPELPELEVAADMHTATEVGGDYYDFDLADNGTLTIAIGDATGHGMRAGAMVTATKSLFTSLGHDGGEPDLSETLTRFTRTIKRMNLRQLWMALTLARFRDGRLRLAAAGMPPAFLYRAASESAESLTMEGAPLGSLVGFPYRETELELAVGDIVLLMSDGFPERLNGAEEMLGYDKALESFTRAAAQANGNPRSVIDQLVADGETWAAGTPAQDDMTFVVLRMRAAAV